VSEAVATGQMTAEEGLRAWMAQVTAEGGLGSNQAFAALLRLADSIAQHGLINPITVRPAPVATLPQVTHWVVTGERRYWAHVLLVVQERVIAPDGQEPSLVRVGFMPEGASVRAHQMVENILREDINGVEKARGLWALRYEMSGVNTAVVDPETIPTSELVPWDAVSDALGFSKRYRIFVTSVLTLTENSQRIIEQYNLSERTIRPIVQKLKGKGALQEAALRQVAVWQQGNEADEAEFHENQAITQAVTRLVDNLLAKAEKAHGREAETVAQAASSIELAEKLSRQARRTLSYIQQAHEPQALARELAFNEKYGATVRELHDLQARIAALLAEVAKYDNG
jgi:predicted transcriptional regulator